MQLRHANQHQRLMALRSLPLFSRCSTTELRRIDRITTEIRVDAGHVLTYLGEPGEEFFVILSGTANVWRDGVLLDVLQPGSFFGEMSLLDHEKRTAYVIAETDMRLLVMCRREFRSPHFLVCSVVEEMLNEVSRRLRRADHGWAASESRHLAST